VGDPNSPVDPDGTRADLGAFYGIGGPPPPGDSCYVSGIIINENGGLPVAGDSVFTTSDSTGKFDLGPLENIGYFIVLISLSGFRDSIFTHIPSVPGDTVNPGTIRVREQPVSVPYISGDINDNGDATPLADPVYGRNFFVGGPPPESVYCDYQYLYAAGDVNANCGFTGLDITYLTSFWRGTYNNLLHCENCRPPRPDTLLLPGGIDPGAPDTILLGNPDLTPLTAAPGDTVSIPVWVKTDEPVAAIISPWPQILPALPAGLAASGLSPFPVGADVHFSLPKRIDLCPVLCRKRCWVGN
jgi:hypothetical protein